MKITTNNQPRDLLCLWDFSEKEQAQLRSYYEWLDDIESNCDFFRYKGSIYNLGNFMNQPQKGWHGALADSYFSGTLVRLSDDGEQVTVGRWCS